MTSRSRLRFALPIAVLGLARVVAACVGDDAPASPSVSTSPDASNGETGAPGDSGAADQVSASQDAADAAKSCKPLAPFGAPELLGVVNMPGVAVNGARLSSDARTIYYGRRSPPSPESPAYIDELLFATRGVSTSPFGVSAPLLTDVDYNKRAANPTLLANQLTLIFNTTGITAGSTHASIATRTSTATDFATAAPVSFVSAPTDSGEPYVNADGSRLYYRSGGDIFAATKDSTSYNVIVQVVPAAAGITYSYPVVSADELTMWLTKGDGATQKIVVTQRKKLDLAFDVPVEVAELNVNLPAYPSWISPDGCDLYLTAAFKMPPVVDTGTLAETHIFRASRTPD